MDKQLTISRSDLVDIATEAMKDSGITEEQHIEMCETAHSMERVLLGAWINEDCGCLVGTAYRNELAPGDWGEEVENKFGRPMRNVGKHFDLLLRSRVEGTRYSAIVKVIDD